MRNFRKYWPHDFCLLRIIMDARVKPAHDSQN
jgi:hypothetical protein